MLHPMEMQPSVNMMPDSLFVLTRFAGAILVSCMHQSAFNGRNLCRWYCVEVWKSSLLEERMLRLA